MVSLLWVSSGSNGWFTGGTDGQRTFNSTLNIGCSEAKACDGSGEGDCTTSGVRGFSRPSDGDHTWKSLQIGDPNHIIGVEDNPN